MGGRIANPQLDHRNSLHCSILVELYGMVNIWTLYLN